MAWSDNVETMQSHKDSLDLPEEDRLGRGSEEKTEALYLCLRCAGQTEKFRINPSNIRLVLDRIDMAAENDRVLDLFDRDFGCRDRIRINPKHAVAWWLEDLNGTRR